MARGMRRNLQNDAKDGIELLGTKSRPGGTVSATHCVCQVVRKSKLVVACSSTPPNSSLGHQLENRIVSGQWSKSFGRGAGGHGEIALHCQLVAVEVRFQDLRLFIL